MAVTKTMRTNATASQKATIVVTAALLFMSGMASGALVMKYMHRHTFRTVITKDDEARSIENLKKQLDLTPDQVQQVTVVLDDFATYYDTVLASGKAKIIQILNPDQRVKFEKIMKEQKER